MSGARSRILKTHLLDQKRTILKKGIQGHYYTTFIVILLHVGFRIASIIHCFIRSVPLLVYQLLVSMRSTCLCGGGSDGIGRRLREEHVSIKDRPLLTYRLIGCWT